MSQLQCACEGLYEEKCPKVTTKVTPSQRSSLFSTLRVFQDIVTKCLKTWSFAVIAMHSATHGADFGGQTEASFPLDKVRSACCSF